MSEANQAILQANIGKEVTVILGDGGSSSVFSGMLRKEEEDGVVYWSVLSPRGIVAQGGTQLPVPETLVVFGAQRLGHLVVRQETTEEALEKIQEEAKTGASGIVSPNGSLLS